MKIACGFWLRAWECGRRWVKCDPVATADVVILVQRDYSIFCRIALPLSRASSKTKGDRVTRSLHVRYRLTQVHRNTWLEFAFHHACGRWANSEQSLACIETSVSKTPEANNVPLTRVESSWRSVTDSKRCSSSLRSKLDVCCASPATAPNLKLSNVSAPTKTEQLFFNLTMTTPLWDISLPITDKPSHLPVASAVASRAKRISVVRRLHSRRARRGPAVLASALHRRSLAHHRKARPTCVSKRRRHARACLRQSRAYGGGNIRQGSVR